MNFLAHAYLSFENPDILIGNMITDFLRGSQKKAYPKVIQQGIQLHHEIDEFTDNHPATLRAKEYLRNACGRYCGVFMDVVYDHFLAIDPHYFSLPSLALFTKNTYQTIERYDKVFPENFRKVFLVMKEYDWLYSYHSPNGIERAFKGLYHRAHYLPESPAAFKAFQEHYSKLQQNYSQFMPELTAFTQTQLSTSSL